MSKILFVDTTVGMSISDVARGYRNALINADHELKIYQMRQRMGYHMRALPAEITDPGVIARQASENVVVEALCHSVDYAVIISALNVHPIALWLLQRIGVPTAVVLTESPYDDEQQSQWVDMVPHGGDNNLVHVFTNDRYSAETKGWHLLRPSFDPMIHRPVEPDPKYACDVLFIGTGWPERQAFLERVDWTGIDFRIYGIWHQLAEDHNSPIARFLNPVIIDNEEAVKMYCSAKVCLNFHRGNSDALTWNPRVVELAACGACQLSDSRDDMVTVFGDSIPTFENTTDFNFTLRYLLQDEERRRYLAQLARERVQGQTFDRRAADMMAVLAGNQPSAANEPETALAGKG